MHINLTNETDAAFLAYFDTKFRSYIALSSANDYGHYIFFATCSALLGLPSNTLLLVILMRIGLYTRRQSALTLMPKKSTGSFERFLFEIVLIDTLMIIYDFVDNILSYIEGDRTAGRHYLIHVSDFCCKFFTYVPKMSVPLLTWLLLFLIINQLILTMDYQNNQRAFWNRGLHYVNAKYSTVFLVFIFSVVSIYPIEVIKYQRKEDLQDYPKGGAPMVCSMGSDDKNPLLLKATNYCNNLLGISIPCVVILIISIIIIVRTCRHNRYMNKEGISLHYIAGTIGIIHVLFNLSGRLTDILLLVLTSYESSFYEQLIRFNHEAYALVALSYGYKFFVCICISRRFRLHAKSVVCFLIENNYEDRHMIDSISTNDSWQRSSQRKKSKRHHRYRTNSYFQYLSLLKPTLTNFSSLFMHKDDLERYVSSESTYWIRPYFTLNERRHFLRPCGRSASCHHISALLFPSKRVSSKEVDGYCSKIISVDLPNGEQIHLPLPQKRASEYPNSCPIDFKYIDEQSKSNGNVLRSPYPYC